MIIKSIQTYIICKFNVNFTLQAKPNLIKENNSIFRFLDDLLTLLWILILAIPSCLYFLIAYPLYKVFKRLYGLWLNIRFRISNRSTQKFILFVYSDHNSHSDYLKEYIIPQLEDRVFFLNWSQRATWNKSELAVKVFSHWSGDINFNPMAIIFDKKLEVKTIRFYQAFKNKNHGDSALLKQKEQELFSYLSCE